MYCPCHTKRLSTRHDTRRNVTKYHACHAKRSNTTFQTSKNDPFCRTYHRHGHTGSTQTVADGWATSSEHTRNPQTPRVKREPLLRIPEKTNGSFNGFLLPYLFTRPEPADDEPTTSPRSAELEAASSPLVLLLPRRHFSWDKS